MISSDPVRENIDLLEQEVKIYNLEGNTNIKGNFLMEWRYALK